MSPNADDGWQGAGVPKKIPKGKNCHSQKSVWQIVQEICHMYLLPPRHLLFNYEKVKVYCGKLNITIVIGNWRPKDSVWSNHLGWTQHTVAMEQNIENYDFGLKDANVNILKKNTVIKSHKCNQCDYASSNAGHLRAHLKMHSGEKSNKCNQCDFASSQAGNLRRHLKTHSGQKSN